MLSVRLSRRCVCSLLSFVVTVGLSFAAGYLVCFTQFEFHVPRDVVASCNGAYHASWVLSGQIDIARRELEKCGVEWYVVVDEAYQVRLALSARPATRSQPPFAPPERPLPEGHPDL